jgi:uncharacterized protein YeaO (DUF488 family)
MKKVFFVLLTLLTASARSEVFKCQLNSGNTIYQSSPCSAAAKQQTVEIQRLDPRKVAEEEAKLKTWKEDFTIREAARIKAEKERQAELDRKVSLEYQRQQAYEIKRQADAMEQRNTQPFYQQQFYPYYPAYQALPAYPSHIPHHHSEFMERNHTDTQQSGGSGIRIDKDSNIDRAKIIFNSK